MWFSSHGTGSATILSPGCAAKEAIATIETLRQKFPISLLVMGNQTTAKQWKQQLIS